MGGFYINLDASRAEAPISSFAKRGLASSVRYEDGPSIVKYKKLLFVEDSNIFENSNVLIFAAGTFRLRNESSKPTFQAIVDDLLSSKVPEVYGHFTIVKFDKERLELDIYFDEAGYGAPYIVGRGFISSSFLACCEWSKTLSLDHSAIFEQIYTGCYFLGKTTFAEVKRVINRDSWTSGGVKVSISPIVVSAEDLQISGRKEALDAQQHVLSTYFKGWSRQICLYGGDIGLSSGYDSRLILGLLHKSGIDFQVHSYWKKHIDFDNEIAFQLAGVLGKELKRVPIRDRDLLTDEEIQSILVDALLYYDGLYPSNHGWTREYRSISHRVSILGNSRFGLSGIGGEQYRNEYHLRLKSYSFEHVMREMVLDGDNYLALKSSAFFEEGTALLRDTIYKGLDIQIKNASLNRQDIQRFYCEMWVPGGPGVRNQIENQISYFLSPFADRYLQKMAYQAMPYLGRGGRFQADLITQIAPQLAAIRSDYGFSFNAVPFYHEALCLVSSLPGKTVKSRFKGILKKKRPYLDSFGPHRGLMERKLNFLSQFPFRFPMSSRYFGQDSVDRLIALSTLIQYFLTKVKDD